MIHPPEQRAFVKIWNGAARRLAVPVLRPSLMLADVVDTARKRTRYDGSNGLNILEPLEILLTSLRDSGDLHAFGQFYVRAVITNLLENRLKLFNFWQQRPDILRQRLERPVFILGLPRTGTSLLFDLLSRDPCHRFLSNWETTVSQIDPIARQPGGRSRRRIGKRLVRLQDYLAPDLKSIHRFHLDGPEECTPLLMQSLSTQALAGMFNAPAYSAWLDSAPHLETYRHHRRTLQTLQWTYPAQRWLLKSPDHTAAVNAILEVYPDACLIQLHRDPAKSVSSWADLNAVFRESIAVSWTVNCWDSKYWKG